MRIEWFGVMSRVWEVVMAGIVRIWGGLGSCGSY